MLVRCRTQELDKITFATFDLMSTKNLLKCNVDHCLKEMKKTMEIMLDVYIDSCKNPHCKKNYEEAKGIIKANTFDAQSYKRFSILMTS